MTRQTGMSEHEVWDLRRQSVNAVGGNAGLRVIAEYSGLMPARDDLWPRDGKSTQSAIAFLTRQRQEFVGAHDRVISMGSPDASFSGTLLGTQVDARNWQVVHFLKGAIQVTDEASAGWSAYGPELHPIQALRVLANLESGRDGRILAIRMALQSRGLSVDP
ncbi:hypothetical protein ACFWGN_11930 [Oerskovia sp. NPDC060338]|uniref:hypothetical protein n=1 Tax=Oerskovia sp. NPDC060338 TaxID=3347100 RepID=UPI003654E273